MELNVANAAGRRDSPSRAGGTPDIRAGVDQMAMTLTIAVSASKSLGLRV